MTKELLPIGTKVTVDTNVSGEVCFSSVIDAYNPVYFSNEVNFIENASAGDNVGTIVFVVEDTGCQHYNVQFQKSGNYAWVYDAMVTPVVSQ